MPRVLIVDDDASATQSLRRLLEAAEFVVEEETDSARASRTTPAVAAGIEEKPWTLEDVVALTERFQREKEDSKFEAAFALADNS